MEQAQRRARLPVRGGVHILRHPFRSDLAMRGAPAQAIQELAGHANLTTTMRYMHLSPGAKDAAIRLLDRRPVRDEDGGGDVGETTKPASAGSGVL
jgi:integrase